MGRVNADRVLGTSRIATVLLLFVAFVVGGQVAPAVAPFVPCQTAFAQEEGAAAAPAAADDGEPKKAAKKEESLLVWFLKALGVRYVISFGILSFSFVAILVMCILSVRQDTICPKALVGAFEANLNEKKFQEAFDLAKNDESFLGKVLAEGMQNLQGGYDKSLEAMAQVAEEEALRLDQRLSYISMIGTIAPMVGLLGTVDGMVASFMVIARSDATPKASELADGISTALITTLVGLVMAIPAILAFNLLKNRSTWMVMEVGQQTSRLMSRFEKK